jgi:hypothetical protein
MASLIEWGAAGRALDVVSGDRHVVVPFEGGALVALLDGLGHGPDAADAALAAVPVLEANAHLPVEALIEECHAALRRTRGVVMTLASFRAEDSTLRWTGVGNVAAVLIRAEAPPDLVDRALTSRPGVVGYQLPRVHVETLPIVPGDLVMLTTDGIESGFTSRALEDRPAQEMAESILARFGTIADDAHVVVVRYVGAAK